MRTSAALDYDFVFLDFELTSLNCSNNHHGSWFFFKISHDFMEIFLKKVVQFRLMFRLFAKFLSQ